MTTCGSPATRAWTSSRGAISSLPELSRRHEAVASRIAMLQLASALQNPDVDLEDLERLISTDVALSYRLLQHINSAHFGLRGQINSINQAVALLGIEQLRRWATVAIFAQLSDKPRELSVTALVRARFCELAGTEADGPASERFTLGLFSVLDAMTDTPMPQILADLPLAPSVRSALTEHSGAGRLLDCVIALESGDFERAHHIVPGLLRGRTSSRFCGAPRRPSSCSPDGTAPRSAPARSRRRRTGGGRRPPRRCR